jgi:hypothetical protein
MSFFLRAVISPVEEFVSDKTGKVKAESNCGTSTSLQDFMAVS